MFYLDPCILKWIRKCITLPSQWELYAYKSHTEYQLSLSCLYCLMFDDTGQWWQQNGSLLGWPYQFVRLLHLCFYLFVSDSSDVFYVSSLETGEELILYQRWKQHLNTDPCVLTSTQMRSWLEEVWHAASAALWSDSHPGSRGTSRPSPWSVPCTPWPLLTGRSQTHAPSETSGSDRGGTQLYMTGVC